MDDPIISADSNSLFAVRQCKDCLELKPTDSFGSASHLCKNCAKERQRDQKYRHKFGIGLRDRDKLLEAQGHSCALCGRPLDDRHTDKCNWFATDHDHDTGVVRGLTHVGCNAALGQFGDSVEQLEQAQYYLLKTKNVIGVPCEVTCG